MKEAAKKWQHSDMMGIVPVGFRTTSNECQKASAIYYESINPRNELCWHSSASSILIFQFGHSPEKSAQVRLSSSFWDALCSTSTNVTNYAAFGNDRFPLENLQSQDAALAEGVKFFHLLLYHNHSFRTLTSLHG